MPEHHRNERSHPSVGDGFHTVVQMKPRQLIFHLLYSLDSFPQPWISGVQLWQLGSGVQEGVSAESLGEDLTTFSMKDLNWSCVLRVSQVIRALLIKMVMVVTLGVQDSTTIFISSSVLVIFKVILHNLVA